MTNKDQIKVFHFFYRIFNRYIISIMEVNRMEVYDLFKHWDAEIRPTTLSCIQRLTEEQLLWKPPGWHSSVQDLVFHMCNVEWVWIYRNLLKKEPWEARWIHKHFDSLQSLLDYWDEIHKETIHFLQNTSFSELNKKYPMPYEDYPEVTLLWLINHVIEHEIHHRGQMIMLMRMMNVEPPMV